MAVIRYIQDKALESIMTFGFVVMKFIILFGLLAMTNGEVSYVPRITDSIHNCKNFDNKVLDCCGLVLGSSQGEEGDNAAKLGGSLETLTDISDDIDIEIDIWKLTDVAEEYMWNIRVGFCASLKDENAPWFPIVETLNMSCPVPANVFKIDAVEISLNSVKDVLSHEFCGDYRMEMSFMDKADKLSCHVIEMAIDEVNDDD